MFDLIGISPQIFFGQLLIGAINGSFYALLSLGLAIIFGMLNIINFAHGALYMLGAFCAWFLLNFLGVNYWLSLLLAPIVIALLGVVIERTMLRRLAGLDHLYGLLLTFGLALIIQGLFQLQFGSSGLPYPAPELLRGGTDLGFMYLPNYRAWVIIFSLIVSLLTWFLIERTRLGAYLRAATENPTLVRAFGLNVPRMITLTYAFGVGLAALAGVMAAPLTQVRSLMGADLIIVVFAVVVIGGMGSIMGAIVTGFLLGLVEGLTKVFWPEASNMIVFAVMACVLLVKPAGLFGKSIEATGAVESASVSTGDFRRRDAMIINFVVGALALFLAILPFTGLVYPYFIMQMLCFALFACAFNLLIGYVGLLSFGHAMFLGVAGYATAHAIKIWGMPSELAILFGMLSAAALGVIVGGVVIRRQGIYFSMITLALSQMVYFICLQIPFTQGEDGIQGVPQNHFLYFFDLANPTSLYYVVLIIFVCGFLLIQRTINSPFGDILKAIRENEPRAISLGYKTKHYKLLAFVISSAFAGLAGATKVIVTQSATLADVHWSMSGEVILMSLIGGLGTVFGPVVGAFLISMMQQYLAPFGQWVTVLQGLVFVACVLAFRHGIVGEILRFKKSRATPPASI
jgi:branched-chain amino acid transport system permease protein